MTKEKIIKIANIKVDVYLKFMEIEKIIKSAIKRPWPNIAVEKSTITRDEVVEQRKKLNKALLKLKSLQSDLYRCE